MRFSRLQYSILLATLPSLSFAAYEPAAESSAEPTTTIYSTSTNTITQTIIAASITRTLTSSTSVVSVPLTTAVSSPETEVPVSTVSSAPSSLLLPPSSAAPYPILQSSFAVLTSGTASPSGTGAPATPNPSIEPFTGAGSRLGGRWVGIAGALVVGLGFLAV